MVSGRAATQSSPGTTRRSGRRRAVDRGGGGGGASGLGIRARLSTRGQRGCSARGCLEQRGRVSDIDSIEAAYGQIADGFAPEYEAAA